MPNLRSAIMVGIIAVVTILLRFIPFLIFRNRETPKFVAYLGKALPYAIMGMLVVYCLKGVSFIKSPYGLPELIACALVALVHFWKRNTLLSILSGTVVYMLMVQLIF
ncbi:MAG: branched-chain amino acid transporter permease [Clostridia bacterium]|nr:branched-chain amino acid transporter permease [Clostridia bacterium]